MQPLPPITNINTIDDVINAIESIINWSIANESRLGYFGALYKRITIAIKQNLPKFQDPARMERLDVTFASRYFAALNAWFWPAQYSPLSQCWRVAFQAAALPKPIIIQHLLAGVNAHINLDLGIAAAETSPGAELPSLQSDFNLVNEVLANEVAGVLDEIDELSPVLAELYDVFSKFETDIIDHMLEFTREEAWSFAVLLAPLDAQQQAVEIAKRDVFVAGVGAQIITPPALFDAIIDAIALLETRDVVKIIETLNAQANAVAARTV
ncbi:MAG TPA: DUF5995 family protein [Thermoanaerobaculia bacterium]